MSVEGKSCDRCKFWERKRPEAPSGFCRRFPPQIIHVGDSRPHHYFPVTLPHDWCGEFDQRLRP